MTHTYRLHTEREVQYSTEWCNNFPLCRKQIDANFAQVVQLNDEIEYEQVVGGRCYCVEQKGDLMLQLFYAYYV